MDPSCHLRCSKTVNDDISRKYKNMLILTSYNTNEIDIRFIESHTHHSSQSSLIIPAAFSAIPYNEELKCAES
jgi:hypothetical protein